MSITQYRCGELNRREAVIADGTLNGIDFLEVATLDQLDLRLGFFLPVTNLTPGHFRIEGGVRITGITVIEVTGQPGKILTLKVSDRGDFSTYTLRVIDPALGDVPPAGFDPQLSDVEFSFKIACPNQFDCKIVDTCPPPRVREPEIDYLAKDYASFRRLMLDRISTLMPDWRERNPADAQITLVELLAYAADHLSYAQDATATEAYLGTARSRVSLRRHALLLDYHIGEGCNARAWVALTVTTDADGITLPGANAALSVAGTKFTTRLPDQPTLLTALPASAPRNATVFETLHDLTLYAAHNRIDFYTWSDSACCLPRGATRATLSNQDGLALEPGDLVLFEEICSPVTGLAADADPTHRHVVRLETVTLVTPANITLADPLTGQAIAEISWRAEDALPFPLCLSARLATGDAKGEVVPVAVARGNIVLADHGCTVPDKKLVPPTVPDEGNYRPSLPFADLTFAAPYDAETVVKDELTGAIITVEPAANAFAFTADRALPAVRLAAADETWFPRSHLLASDRFAPEFVVEMERDGLAKLRFGDAKRGGLGKSPTAGTAFAATFRVGGGTSGNLGAEALRHLLAPPLLLPAGSITAVRNPLPARGGTAPESFEQVRQFAPQAFRRQERAVTEADWAEVAQRYPGVQKAAARFRWTGSWHTVFVTIDRVGGMAAAQDERFQAGLRAHLEKYRIAGYDLEIQDPVYIPLDLVLLVCVRPGYFRSDVLAALLRVFSRQEFTDGTLGFFHPDNLTFGQPLFLSRVCAAAMGITGVASVQVKKFQRWGRPANHELANAVITAAPLEILRLDNDRNFPENGKIEFELHGGL
jgi:hypothetical protein